MLQPSGALQRHGGQLHQNNPQQQLHNQRGELDLQPYLNQINAYPFQILQFQVNLNILVLPPQGYGHQNQ